MVKITKALIETYKAVTKTYPCLEKHHDKICIHKSSYSDEEYDYQEGELHYRSSDGSFYHEGSEHCYAQHYWMAESLGLDAGSHVEIVKVSSILGVDSSFVLISETLALALLQPELEPQTAKL